MSRKNDRVAIAWAKAHAAKAQADHARAQADAMEIARRSVTDAADREAAARRVARLKEVVTGHQIQLTIRAEELRLAAQSSKENPHV